MKTALYPNTLTFFFRNTVLGEENDRKPNQTDYHLFLYPIYEIVKNKNMNWYKLLNMTQHLVCAIQLNFCNCDNRIQHPTKLQLNPIQCIWFETPTHFYWLK